MYGWKEIESKKYHIFIVHKSAFYVDINNVAGVINVNGYIYNVQTNLTFNNVDECIAYLNTI